MTAMTPIMFRAVSEEWYTSGDPHSASGDAPHRVLAELGKSEF